MKIAMIGHKRIPSREGGIEVVVEELAVRMASLGHDVTVYNRGGAHVAGKKFNTHDLNSGDDLPVYRGVRVVTVPTPANKTMNAMVYSLFATVRALFGHYDIIHYHAEGPGVMLFIARIFGNTAVATVHGLDWQRSKWGGFATRYLLLGEKIIAKRANAVIVLSENVKGYFKRTYLRDTHFIPNGITVPERRGPDVIKTRYGIGKDDYILFLARLVPEKGLHYLLEAFMGVATDKKLVVAGGVSHSDGYAAEVSAMAAKDRRVIMTGFVSGEELSELYTNCLLYVLPSDVEGMPLTLLEAMSYGCRCLISDIPENTSVAGGNAVSFRRGDAADLGNKLLTILGTKSGDGKGVKLFPDGNAISKYVLDRYNWDDVVRHTLELYEESISGYGGVNTNRKMR